MAALTPEARAALIARIAFCRDLGIFDLYRRETGDDSITLDDAGPAVAPPLLSSTEEFAIASKRSMPAASLVALSDVATVKEQRPTLTEVREDLGDCTRCKLSKTRNKIVFGDGDPKARLLFVGEGPGADEDAQGVPFVGRGGQLLNNMINAMGLKREQVYIANIVKCRPPSNRVPEPDEAHTCMPFLERQIAAVQPEVIVALGSTAATYLLGVKSALGSLRGKIHASRGAKLIVTYHPAFLLRDPRQKKEAWADLKMAMAELGLRTPAALPPQA